MEVSVAFILLILLSPIILGVIIVLAVVNNDSVFFYQICLGYKAKPFKIIKCKTMRDAFNDTGKRLPDEIRVTRVGQWVRSVSFDELLQLVNVLKRDMSLVGPRPLLMQYLERYTPDQARRQEVKPSITGWAEVNGGNAISSEEKFRLDVEYVDKQSFCLDCKILWITFLNVIQRKGITVDGHATIDELIGTGK